MIRINLTRSLNLKLKFIYLFILEKKSTLETTKKYTIKTPSFSILKIKAQKW